MSKEDNTNKSVTYETKGIRKRYVAIIICILIIVAVGVGLVIWNNNKKEETTDKSDKQTVQDNKENRLNDVNKENEDMNNNEEIKNPIVTMKVKDYGIVKIELYPEIAPNTVKNFISLINEKYYDGLTFHRIVDGFMIQGGDKAGTGYGETDFTIPGEFSVNNFANNLTHAKGVISMARRDYNIEGLREKGYDSAATQFFIMLEDNPGLDGLYAPFGRVIDGIDLIERIGKVETGSNDRPKETVIIESMTVNTFGKDYGEPERLIPFDIQAYLNGR